MRRHLARLDPVLVQAVIAGALSFAHLHDIALAAGQDGWKAWAYPVSVDLLFIAAWRRLRTLRADHGATRSAWTWFVIALAASLGANIATAGLLDLNDVPIWLRILVAGWPALAFFGGTLLAHKPASPGPLPVPEQVEDVMTDRVTETAPVAPDLEPEALPAPADEPRELPAAPEPTPVMEPEPVAVPVTPEPEPVPDPEPVPAPALAVPPALLDHARKIADTHRITTGARIDADTLRARLGVPAPLATAITAQLT
ncbi:DUF2637 domain-containing protein [Streptomyces sp. NPDC002067]